MTDLVVIGLGYVGLPLVVEAARRGVSVAGLDVSERVVADLNAGRSHVDDLSDNDIAEAVAGGFRATTDPTVVTGAGAVVICVPTPLSGDGGPDLSAVEASCHAIGSHLTAGTLVVLESTTYPGTTAEVVEPLLAELSGLARDDLPVAYSPERIDPGNPRFGLRNTPKIVGADHPGARERARALYARLVDEIVIASGTREAESAKLLENTYRHVNIALVNEMAKFFHELDIDFWEVIRLAETKPFGFHAFRPGPGVGGHCIPIDPNYLSHRVRNELGYSFRFVELAQEVNLSMPRYVATRAAELLNDQGRAVRGSTVALLGVTYKPDVADERESPAVALADRLLQLGAIVVFHDPYVIEWTAVPQAVRGDDPGELARGAHLTILLQHHAAYDIAELEAAAVTMLDTRGVTSASGRAHRL